MKTELEAINKTVFSKKQNILKQLNVLVLDHKTLTKKRMEAFNEQFIIHLIDVTYMEEMARCVRKAQVFLKLF